MILKMWNEVTDSWVFVDNAESVSVNKNYTLRLNDRNEVEAVLCVYKPKGTDTQLKNADLLLGPWIPLERATEEIKNCDDFFLSRNINSQYVTDYVLVSPHSNYKDEYDLTYFAKIIVINSYSYTGEGTDRKQCSYLLPCKHECAVYLLNDDGKTIERI